MIFFKRINSKKGGISAIHAIVVAAIMLGVLFLSFFIFNAKVKDKGEMINDKIVSEFENEDFVLTKPIELPPIEKDNDDTIIDNPDDLIDDDRKGDDLETDKNDNNNELKQIAITLERNQIQSREVIITLPNLDEIVEIKSSNNGLVEIISVNKDEVTIKVTNGKPNDYIVLSGTYLPGGSKLVDMQDNPNYSDTYGYKGTLNRYLATYAPPETIVVDNYIVESMTNSFPATQKYTEKGHSINLNKKGNSVATVIQGSPSKSKTVEMQDSPTYIEKISDNGIETSYTGTLAQYVYSGEASVSKTGTISETSYINSFPNTVAFNENKFTGTLNKSGSVITTIDKGSASHTKIVEVQNNSNYVESYSDNGIQTAYSGTLTQYVYQGSELKTKSVSNQTNSSYIESINDNGINTTYTGTLAQYVASGYAPDSKVYTITDYNYSNNNFADTKAITDGLYSGTISKSGIVNQYNGGSAPVSKYVSGQYNSWYNDGSYSGSLTQYVASGSASDSQYVTNQTSSWYNDGTYSGSLSQYLKSGSAPSEKYVTDTKTGSSASSSYISYNSGGYKGTLNRTSMKGSSSTNLSLPLSGTPAQICQHQVRYEYKNYYVSNTYSLTYGSRIPKGQTASTCSIIYPNGMSYSFSYNDNGVSIPSYGQITTYLKYGNPRSDKTCPPKSDYATAICTETWTATYTGTYSKPDTRVSEYSGTVKTDDTRIYAYQGTVTKPDTRSYAYAGTVWTDDTRYNYWTQTYSGTIYRPDSRVYRYQGTVTKPDTRVYKYRGNVTKPDTRVYKYTQNYAGTVKTEDTRVWKYKGTVTKPDTRVYKYSQVYNGTLHIPEVAIYKYKGIVTKPANDTRVIENYYKYDLDIKYKEK